MVFFVHLPQNWFGPIPQVLTDAIDRNILTGLDFLRLYGTYRNHHAFLNRTSPTAVRVDEPMKSEVLVSEVLVSEERRGSEAPSQFSNLRSSHAHSSIEADRLSVSDFYPSTDASYQEHSSKERQLQNKGHHVNSSTMNAVASVVLTPNDDRRSPFCGPWQYSIAQSYLANIFGASGECARPELYHKLLSGAGSIDLLNLDVLVCTMLGIPLVDRIDFDQRKAMMEYLKNQRIGDQRGTDCIGGSSKNSKVIEHITFCDFFLQPGPHKNPVQTEMKLQ